MPVISREFWGLKIVADPGEIIVDSNFKEKLSLMIEACAVHQTHHVLVVPQHDDILERYITLLGVFDGVVHLHSQNVPGLVIAVASVACFQSEKAELMMDAAANRGIRVDFFKSEYEAIEWLRTSS